MMKFSMIYAALAVGVIASVVATDIGEPPRLRGAEIRSKAQKEQDMIAMSLDDSSRSRNRRSDMKAQDNRDLVSVMDETRDVESGEPPLSSLELGGGPRTPTAERQLKDDIEDYYLSILFDCHHTDIDKSTSNSGNRIVVSFYSHEEFLGSKELLKLETDEEMKWYEAIWHGGSDNKWAYGCSASAFRPSAGIKFSPPFKEFTHAIAEIDGDDAFFIDRATLSFGYRHNNDRSSKQLWEYEWGKNNGGGWCLSTDPNDEFGGREDGGCFKTLAFVKEPDHDVLTSTSNFKNTEGSLCDSETPCLPPLMCNHGECIHEEHLRGKSSGCGGPYKCKEPFHCNEFFGICADEDAYPAQHELSPCNQDPDCTDIAGDGYTVCARGICRRPAGSPCGDFYGHAPWILNPYDYDFQCASDSCVSVRIEGRRPSTWQCVDAGWFVRLYVKDEKHAGSPDDIRFTFFDDSDEVASVDHKWEIKDGDVLDSKVVAASSVTKIRVEALGGDALKLAKVEVYRNKVLMKDWSYSDRLCLSTYWDTCQDFENFYLTTSLGDHCENDSSCDETPGLTCNTAVDKCDDHTQGSYGAFCDNDSHCDEGNTCSMYMNKCDKRTPGAPLALCEYNDHCTHEDANTCHLVPHDGEWRCMVPAGGKCDFSVNPAVQDHNDYNYRCTTGTCSEDWICV